MPTHRTSIKNKFGYKVGSFLGRLTVILFLVGTILLIAATIAGIHILTGVSGWLLWIGTIAACLFVLWLLPLGWDLIVLIPLAIWGAYKGWGLPWMPAAILMSVPALLVLLLSRLSSDS